MAETVYRVDLSEDQLDAIKEAIRVGGTQLNGETRRLLWIIVSEAAAPPAVVQPEQAEWQSIAQDTHRLRVHGGWMVTTGVAAEREAAIFVPDPKWEWERL